MTEPATPQIVNRDKWERARVELLVCEKAHTRAGATNSPPPAGADGHKSIRTFGGHQAPRS